MAIDTVSILPTVASLRAVDPKTIGDALVRPGVLAAVERASAGGGAVTDETINAALTDTTAAARLAMHHAELLMERSIITPARRAGLDVKGFGA